MHAVRCYKGGGLSGLTYAYECVGNPNELFRGIDGGPHMRFLSALPAALPAERRSPTLAELRAIGSVDEAEKYVTDGEMNAVFRESLDGQMYPSATVAPMPSPASHLSPKA